MEKVSIKEGILGDYRVERFYVDKPDIHSMLRGRGVPKGEYTRLMRCNTVVMSDTPAEMRDHMFAVHRATGSCLINGLGIGMVLHNILKKDEVTDITVVEISQDVIDLVSPNYTDDRITFVCADALEYKPPKNKKYGMVWHDIWDYICADNLPEMHKLHRKYGKKAIWQGSWCRSECERNR